MLSVISLFMTISTWWLFSSTLVKEGTNHLTFVCFILPSHFFSGKTNYISSLNMNVGIFIILWKYFSSWVNFLIFLHRIMEQNQLLNFIIIDQYYFVNKIKKSIWNYFTSTYISNFHKCTRYIVLQIFNLHFIFIFFFFSQLKKGTIKLVFSHYFDSNDRLYFNMFDLSFP